MAVRQIGEIVHATFLQWFKGDLFTIAAALAFYTAVSTAPLVVIVIAYTSLSRTRRRG